MGKKTTKRKRGGGGAAQIEKKRNDDEGKKESKGGNGVRESEEARCSGRADGRKERVMAGREAREWRS